jgi:tRNA pseudouridine32 synthase / 23S rRNA pseudouridine746 synthase
MSTQPPESYWNSFKADISGYSLPESLQLMKSGTDPHPICCLAATELQFHLKSQTDLSHNFGFDDKMDTPVIGKMFGVLVVRNKNDEVGYLAGFSGKLAGSFHHELFVPPVYDSLTEGSFLNLGMQELSRINNRLRRIVLDSSADEATVNQLKIERKEHSVNLQNLLFDQFVLLNCKAEEMSLRSIFNPEELDGKNPPAGAGECAGIKLLQYAFKNQLKPLALAEFWWGKSPKSTTWKHGHFYECCEEKCSPILKFMLNDSH